MTTATTKASETTACEGHRVTTATTTANETTACEGPRVHAIAGLVDAGFDLVHAFDAAAAAREPGWEFLAHDTRRVGLLVCNTRALWPRFVAEMRDPALAAESDPLDRYTERTIERAFPGAPIYYGHREYGAISTPGGSSAPHVGGALAPGGSSAPHVGTAVAPGGSSAPHVGGAFLSFTRLAVVTGLGALAPSHLVIHPIYGPWFALRAVILVAGDPPVTSPIPSPCTCGPACAAALSAALASTSWEAWLAVRDACSLKAWRYSDEQIRYHYTKEWIPPVETP